MYYTSQTIVSVEAGDCDVTEIHVALFTQKLSCVVTTETDGSDVMEDFLFDKPRILQGRLIVITVTKLRLIIITVTKIKLILITVKN